MRNGGKIPIYINALGRYDFGDILTIMHSEHRWKKKGKK